jgi:diaminopropionate ammonia-lyase
VESFINPSARSAALARPGREPLGLHARLPGYAPTPLADCGELAARIGIGQLLVKVESARLGLPSFKVLGASWAVYRALLDRVGAQLGSGWETLDELARRTRALRPLTLSAATDGNHGRAVAHMARLLGLEARVYVPSGTARERIDAIAGEGATVEVVDGTYDDAVRRSARDEGPNGIVVSDTSWEGYADIPGWVIDGYSTALWEIDDVLVEPPDVVIVQIGVGALAAAVARHFRGGGGARPRLVGVEPVRSACVLESMRAGRLTTISGGQDSIMAGLNCGTPSAVAWPDVSSGIDRFIAIDDERAREGMRLLADGGVVAGETGAAGVGGLLELLDDRAAAVELGLGPETRVLVLCTEGATDEDAYRAIVGRPPAR